MSTSSVSAATALEDFRGNARLVSDARDGDAALRIVELHVFDRQVFHALESRNDIDRIRFFNGR